MDGSLHVDRRQDVQSPTHSYRCETSPNLETPDKLDYSKRSTGGRPTSLDGTADAPLDPNGTSAKTQEWVLNPPGYPFSQSKSRVEDETDSLEVSDLTVSQESDLSRLEVSSCMRSSTNPPNVHHMSRLDSIGRRRSQSIGSGSRGSRIAALSVQLRTRLSYAAAKIEKKRQSRTIPYQSPTGLLQRNSSTPILSVETLSRAEQPLSMCDLEDQRSAENGSPNGTTVSAPDAPATPSPHLLEAPVRPALVNIASGLYLQPLLDPQKHLGKLSSGQSVPPRLAPPADIGPGRVCQRRRPNPNLPGNSSRYVPFPLHGRRHSQQEPRMDSEAARVPETPPLRPSTHKNLAPYIGLPDNSQSSSMEQDAIETLLFMSSPGTSGYHSNSQNSQRNTDIRNVDGGVPQSGQWLEKIGDSQSSARQHGPFGNIETQAGDEIDAMLDQMNSDSDDDTTYTSSRSTGVDTDSRAIGAVGHMEHR
ncbi:hypothetical protein BJX76DRAFT_181101 [Aspergillus varians]